MYPQTEYEIPVAEVANLNPLIPFGGPACRELSHLLMASNVVSTSPSGIIIHLLPQRIEAGTAVIQRVWESLARHPKAGKSGWWLNPSVHYWSTNHP